MLARLILASASACLTLVACSPVGYYAQVTQGHFALLAAARPVAEWVQDPSTPQTLKERLLRAKEIRRFAAEALALPDNGSYTDYADL